MWRWETKRKAGDLYHKRCLTWIEASGIDGIEILGNLKLAVVFYELLQRRMIRIKAEKEMCR